MLGALCTAVELPLEHWFTVWATWCAGAQAGEGRGWNDPHGPGFKWRTHVCLWIPVSRYTTNSENTTFSFAGLDDGEYKLVESKTPTGYNTIEDMLFNITAEHGTTLVSLNGEPVSGTIELDVSAETGILSTTVVNEKGATLPSTGGIGTTIFYMAGGLLVCVAIVVLVTKKRMAIEE